MELRQDHEASLTLTPEYRLLQSNVKANKLQKRLAVGKNLPAVAIGAGYMYDDLMDHSHPFGITFPTVSLQFVRQRMEELERIQYKNGQTLADYTRQNTIFVR